MKWEDSGPFTAVAIRKTSADGPFETFVQMPAREKLEDAKLDLVCFNNKCQCNNPKNQQRPSGCMRNYPLPAYNGFGYLDYIDNGNGFRALPYKV